MINHYKTSGRIPVFENWYIVREFLSSEDYDSFKEVIDPIDFQDAKTVSDTPDYRNTNIKWVPWEMEWLYDKIWHWTNVANDDLWNFSIGGFKDNAQYGEYEAPDGKYDDHMDIMGNTINHRKISFSCSLNDDYTGGHLEFMVGKEPVIVELGPGDAVFFPSFYLHRVTPVLTGKRESIVQWISGDPYR